MNFPLRKNVLAVLACVFWMTTPVFAQSQESKPVEEPATDSRYSSESPANRAIVFEAHSVLTHDVNIFGDNKHKQGDVLFNEGGLLRVRAKRRAWEIGVEYRPEVLLYRTGSGLNQFNHNVIVDTTTHAIRHITLHVKDSMNYQTGILGPRANEDSSLPTGLPSSLNYTLFVPLARELSNQTEADAVLEAGRRSAFDFSGAFELRHYSNFGAALSTLFDTKVATGGLGYQYRVARHFTLGGRYLYQKLTFGQGFHDQIQSVYATLLWQARPSVTLNIFAGPQFSDAFGQFAAPSMNPAQPTAFLISGRGKQLGAGAGGTLAWRSTRTVLRFTGQRLITDGGGLLTSVTNSFEGIELRRRVFRLMDVVLTGGNSRAAALLGPSVRGNIRAQTASAAVERAIHGNVGARGEDQFIRQRVNPEVPFCASV